MAGTLAGIRREISIHPGTHISIAVQCLEFIIFSEQVRRFGPQSCFPLMSATLRRTDKFLINIYGSLNIEIVNDVEEEVSRFRCLRSDVISYGLIN